MKPFNRLDLHSLKPMSLGERNPGMELVQDFLVRQRHIAPGAYEAAKLDAPTSLAIKSFQKKFGLNESGEIDEPTLESLVMPRCGMRDHSLSLSRECSWPAGQLHYSYENVTADVSESRAKGAVARAFTTWAQHCPVTFEEVDKTADHEISIAWRDAFDSDYDLVGADIAHADYPGTCAEVNPGGAKPIHFDASECKWTDDVNWARDDTLLIPVYDIETVALHEIGHILGLRHSSVPGEVMYGAIPRRAQRVLASNDLARISYLYS